MSTARIDSWIEEIMTFVDNAEFCSEWDRYEEDGLCDSRYMDSVREFKEALLF